MKRGIRKIILQTVAFFLVVLSAMADDDISPEATNLLNSAATHFSNGLLPAERKLILNLGFADCTPAISGPGNQYRAGANDTNTADAGLWSTNRNIRADCIAWLCAKSKGQLSGDGIRIINARIISTDSTDTNVTLNLESAAFPVRIEGCSFTNGVLDLDNAHVSELNLNGTHLKEIDAYQFTADDGIWLGFGFIADGPVHFYVANIGGDFDCGGGHFLYADTNIDSFALDVLGCKINGYAYLCGDFDGKVIFRDTVVDKFFDWYFVSNADKADLDLSFLKVGKFQDNTASWPAPGHLHLNGFTYDSIENVDSRSDSIDHKVNKRLKWFNLQPTNEFHPQPFLQYASVLRNEGYIEEANTVMIEENDRLTHFLPFWSLSRFFHFVFGSLLNYGYRLTPAIVITVALIILGWFFAALGFKKSFRQCSPNRVFPMMLVEIVTGSKYSSAGNLFSPSDLDLAFQDGKYSEMTYPKFNALIYSIESFLPLVKLGVGDYWHINDAPADVTVNVKPVKHCQPAQWLRLYFWFHTIMGWILITLLLAALTGVIKN